MSWKLSNYGILGSLRLFRDVLITKIFFPNARLIRYPFYFRGLNRMRIGVQFTTGVGTRIDAWGYDNAPCLFIGNNVQINDYVHIGALQHVEIGNNVLIASRVFISDHDHGNYNSADGTSNPIIPPNSRPLVSKPVVIGNNVWVGEQVCILSGITIGDGSVIGAGTVVTRDVPPNCIVVGNPSRIVRIFDDSKGTWVRP